MARTKAVAIRAAKARAIGRYCPKLAALRAEWRGDSYRVEDDRVGRIDELLALIDLEAFKLAQDIESGRVPIDSPDEPRPLFERPTPPGQKTTSPTMPLEEMLEAESEADAEEHEPNDEPSRRFIIRGVGGNPKYVLEARSYGDDQDYLARHHQDRSGWYVNPLTTGEWVALPHWVTSCNTDMDPPSEAEMAPPRQAEMPKRPQAGLAAPLPGMEAPAKKTKTRLKTFKLAYRYDDDTPPMELNEIKAKDFDEAKAILAESYKFGSIRLTDGRTVKINFERMEISQIAGRRRQTAGA